MQIIFEKSIKGRRGVALPKKDVPLNAAIPEKYQRKSAPELCELSELDVVRHFTALSRKNYGVDTNFYPLGSCTMKYNPKICEKIAGMSGFAGVHPMLGIFDAHLHHSAKETVGAMTVIYDLENLLCRVTGMDAFTLQPMAGAHGEFAGMAIIAAYHRKKGNNKKVVLIPDEAHGTNPSTAAVVGYEVKTVPTNPSTGLLDIEAFKAAMDGSVAAVMMTNPNTLGLFNSQIKEIADIAHSFDALLYYDGANLNAIMGKFRPGDGGFDVVHLNLHKTFGTPHGGGGPGAGPVGVKKILEPFLPTPRIIKKTNEEDGCEYFEFSDGYPDSIGPIAPFYGNFSVYLKAYVYILMNGGKGLTAVSEQAVLSANYIMRSLKDYYDVPFLKICMHECVVTPTKAMLANGIKAVDIAKGLIDRGFHPPTVCFPLIVKEALMIEPTETESKETIDDFIAAMIDIAKIAETAPDSLKKAPVTTPVGRLNETKAAKDMDVAFL